MWYEYVQCRRWIPILFRWPCMIWMLLLNMNKFSYLHIIFHMPLAIEYWYDCMLQHSSFNIMTSNNDSNLSLPIWMLEAGQGVDLLYCRYITDIVWIKILCMNKCRRKSTYRASIYNSKIQVHFRVHYKCAALGLWSVEILCMY